MSAVGLLFVLIALTVGLVAAATAVAATRRGIRTLHEERTPAWPRFHVRFYVVAMLFMAFDMEMAYMYPWAVVFRDLGLFAYAEIGFFLAVLMLGLGYAWREGGLRWQ